MVESKKAKTKTEEIALAAAKEAIKELREEEKAGRKKQIFQNTNVLLEHYLDLKAYCGNAVYKGSPREDVEDAYDEESINLDGDEITIKSIKSNREVTMIFIAHIDMALSLLQRKCELKEITEKFEVIDMLHLSEVLQATPWSERISLVSDKLNCGETTVRRWRNEMVKDLSVFLFGVEGLKLGL